MPYVRVGSDLTGHDFIWASGYEDRQNYQELLWANLEGEKVNENE